MTLPADLQNYPANAKVAFLTCSGVVITGEIAEVDTSKVIVARAFAGNVEDEFGFTGHTVTVYLGAIIAHWAA